MIDISYQMHYFIFKKVLKHLQYPLNTHKN